MTNPWNLYDDLIDEIPGHITVAAAYIGTKWCRVTSSERGAGMAFAMPVRTRPASYGEDDLAGLPLREVAALAKSWNLAEAGLGMAAINAYHSLPKPSTCCRAATTSSSPARPSSTRRFRACWSFRATP